MKKSVVETTPKIKISEFPEPTVAKYRYGVKFDTTFPYFGGRRFWFLCSCGKRVTALYQVDGSKPPKCRTCLHLTYQSQGLSGSSRQLWSLLDHIDKAEAVFNGSKQVKLFHKGQATRRFKRYLHHTQMAERLALTQPTPPATVSGTST